VGIRKGLGTPLNDVDQAISKEGGLAPADGQRRFVRVHQLNKVKQLPDSPAVLHVSGWLGAHQAVAVAPLGGKEDVAIVAAAISDSDPLPNRVQLYDVTTFGNA